MKPVAVKLPPRHWDRLLRVTKAQIGMAERHVRVNERIGRTEPEALAYLAELQTTRAAIEKGLGK